MKITINAFTIDLLNNMTATELAHHGVAPADIAEIVKTEEITHLKHIRVQRVGDVWEYEVSDEAIVKMLHLYARAARMIVPLVKPIAFAIKGFIKGIDQLKELMPHVRELEAMADEPAVSNYEHDHERQSRIADQLAAAHAIELHNLRATRTDTLN